MSISLLRRRSNCSTGPSFELGYSVGISIVEVIQRMCAAGQLAVEQGEKLKSGGDDCLLSVLIGE